MAITHLGQDSYFAFQKEAVYNTLLVAGLTYLPLMEGAVTKEQQQIEKKHFIDSRLPQIGQAGRQMVGPNDVKFPIVPDLIGAMMNLFLGAPDAQAGDAVDGYTHIWYSKLAGEAQGVSWSVAQAIGTDLEDQYAGIKCSKILIASDNEGLMTITKTLVGVKRDATGQTRATTVTVSSATQYNFGMGLIEITPSGASKFTQKVNSFEIEIDLGYDEDGNRFKVGSDGVDPPIFGTIPTITFRCEIDAEQRFETWAEEIKSFHIDATLTSPDLAGSDPAAFFVYKLELPGATLQPTIKREIANDNIPMSLEFVVHGGPTTSSPATDRQFEIRVVDDVSTYTGYP